MCTHAHERVTMNPRMLSIALAKIQLCQNNKNVCGYLTNIEYLLLYKEGLRLDEWSTKCEHQRALQGKAIGHVFSRWYFFQQPKHDLKMHNCKPIKRHENKT